MEKRDFIINLCVPALAVLFLSACGEAEREGVDEAKVILREFDGTSPNGSWERALPVDPVFEYEVGKDALEMKNAGVGLNQQLVREGVEVDPARPYAIECDFRINDEKGITSFALNLNVAPDDFGGSPLIDTWSVNMDLKGPTSKAMGFLEGKFKELGKDYRAELPFARKGVWFHVKVRVNQRLDGSLERNWVSTRFFEEGVEQVAFENDFSRHPYKPDFDRSVRIGANSHFADWTMKNLKVYYLD